jgi:heme/copper-type cytochrome/quinol oxidase subunit 3
VLMLVSMVIISSRVGLEKSRGMNVELVGLYWHFVDIVWIVIFTVVYLVQV